MLKLARLDQRDEIIKFCENQALGVRISSYLLTYGFDFEFVSYWLEEIDGEIVCVIAKFEQNITVCMNNKANGEQVREFLQVIGYATLQTRTSIAKALGFSEFEQKQMLKFASNKISSIFEPPLINKDTQNLKQCYELIAKSIPNSFESSKQAYNFWLSDFTFKKRRNLARIFTAEKNETCIACAMTASESKNEALMSGVACKENYRGTGLGKKVVLGLVDVLIKENKAVFIIALNDGVEKFYQKIGFENYKKIAYIQNI